MPEIKLKLIDIRDSKVFILRPKKKYLISLGGVKMGEGHASAFVEQLKDMGITDAIVANYKDLKVYEIKAGAEVILDGDNHNTKKELCLRCGQDENEPSSEKPRRGQSCGDCGKPLPAPWLPKG